MVRKALGKGLDALIPTDDGKITQVYYVSVIPEGGFRVAVETDKLPRIIDIERPRRNLLLQVSTFVPFVVESVSSLTQPRPPPCAAQQKELVL